MANLKLINQKLSGLQGRIDVHNQFFSTATYKHFHEATSRLEDVKYLKSELETLIQDVYAYNAKVQDPQDEVSIEKAADKFLSLYFAISGKYKALEKEYAEQNAPQKSKPQAQTSTQNQSQDGIKLDKIELPKFSGDMAEWSNFYSMYDNLVHKNVKYNNIQKFYHLKSRLHGTALKCIDSFSLQENNYEPAYESLVELYNSPRKLAFFHFSQIVNYKETHKKYSMLEFLTEHRNAYRSLKNLKVDLGEFAPFYICYMNLDDKARRALDKQYPKSLPTMKEFFTFLEERAQADNSQIFEVKNFHVKSLKSSLVTQNGSNGNNKMNCYLCGGDHAIFHCKQFLDMNVFDRENQVKRLRLCFICLSKLHSANDCKSLSSCKKSGCKGRHNTLLHKNKEEFDMVKNKKGAKDQQIKNESKKIVETENNKVDVGNSVSKVLVSISNMPSVTRMGTIKCFARDKYGRFVKVKGVFDTASDSTLASENCVHKLGLRVSKNVDNLSGVDGITTKALGRVNLGVSKKPSQAGYLFSIEALVVSKVCHDLGRIPVSHEFINSLADKFKYLADDKFMEAAEIDILFGLDCIDSILVGGKDSFIAGKPCLVKSKFGYIVMGSYDEKILVDDYLSRQSLVVTRNSINERMSEFLESNSMLNEAMENDDDFCEKFFQATTSRLHNGHYSVSLPFKENKNLLGNNRSLAMQCQMNLERSLERKSEAGIAYHAFMQEFVDLGHMIPAEKESEYILVQHVVRKDSSSTTKFRTVFNGSVRDDKGKSLNSMLFPGKNLQKKISQIIVNFRLNPVALCADLKMAYRQLYVNEKDRKYQHIFYRKNRNEPMVEYEINRLLYGLTPSAFLCQRVIYQLALDEGFLYPLALAAILNSMYIDDIPRSVESIKQAQKLKTELIEIFSRGGFELRKWASSHSEVLDDLPEEHKEKLINFGRDPGFKILGMAWNPSSDSFIFNINKFIGLVTMRNILSYVAKIYDPCNFLAPVIFVAKCFMSRCHKECSNSKWDVELPKNLAEEWITFAESLILLQNLRIPRYVNTDTSKSMNVVGFADASKLGQAAVVFLHQSLDTINCNMVSARTHVASVKKATADRNVKSNDTTPRNELNAALLLAELVREFLVNSNEIIVQNVLCYSDSQVALYWIHSTDKLVDSYVKNRVCKIQEISKLFNIEWRFVRSEDNPADQASRGLKPEKFMQNNELWWHGPPFIQVAFNEILKIEVSGLDNFSESLARKPRDDKRSCVQVKKQSEKSYLYTCLSKFSDFNRAIRVFAIVLRFIRACRKNDNGQKTGLYSELQSSIQKVVLIAQKEFYAQELKGVKTKNSQLLPLDPQVDNVSKCLVVGGRLQKSVLPIRVKHPFIIHKECILVNMIIATYHRMYLHSGLHTLKAMIRQRFWVISLHGAIKKFLKTCVKCLKFSVRTHQPLMSNLPQARLLQCRVFSKVGVDVGGPIKVKTSKLRKAQIVKGYMCLFICLVYRAVHIEFLEDLSTPAMGACIERFINRRGCPSDIFSDNGTNFVGLSNELKEVYEFFKRNKEELENWIAPKGIIWHFNPPSAPNFGGSWEIHIKLAKQLMYKGVSSPLTVEEYFTLFTNIEAILNQRPLCKISDNADLIDYLTPSHFIIGDLLHSLPSLEENEQKINFRDRWIHLKQIRQCFWKRFRYEYLNCITQRNKWTKGTFNPVTDQIVYVTDMGGGVGEYPIGRIIKLHPSDDGVVRVVTVRVHKKEFIRPVNKLILFPLDS